MPEEYLTIAEVAGLLKVKPKSIETKCPREFPKKEFIILVLGV